MATKTSKPVIVRVPAAAPARRAKSSGSFTRRASSAASKLAMSEQHTIAATASAAVFGFMKRQNVNLPHFDALGTPGTYGLVAWAIGRYTKSPMAQHIATGLLSVSAYQLGAGQTLSGGNVMGAVMGEDSGTL